MSCNQDHRQELESLLSQHQDLGLNDQEMQRLSDLLNTHPDMIDLYLDHVEMDAMLRETLGLLNLSQVSDKPSPHCCKPRINGKALLQLAIATLVLLGAGVAVWMSHPASQQLADKTRPAVTVQSADKKPEIKPADVDPVPAIREDVAEIARGAGAILQYDNGAIVATSNGNTLTTGRYELEAGVLEIYYQSGASVIIESPAVFELCSGQHLLLTLGRASARCPTEESKGFSMETPSGVAIDLGTEFAVEVSSEEQGKDQYHVFSGEVIVEPKARQWSGKISLLAGQATQLDHRTSTPAGIDIDHQRFILDFDADSTDYYDQVLELEPVVYYVMRVEGDGRTLRNEMGDYADATIFSSNPDSLYWASGFNGGTAFHMNGMQSETYAVAPDYPKSSTDQLAVVAWVYAESRPWWASIAKNWQHGLEPERRGQFHFGLNNLSGVLEAHVNDNDNIEQFAMESVPLPLNCWHHVAMVADGAVLRLYRNGKEVAATPYNGLNGNPNIKPLAIGSKLGDDSSEPARQDSGFWDGRIDHLAIFNKALTPEQIENLYEVGHISTRDYNASP